MARFFTKSTEIVRRGHDALPPKMVPYPIRNDSRGERIVGTYDIFGIFQPANGVLWIGCVVQRLEEATRHGIARLFVVASDEKRLVERLVVEDARGQARR